MRWRSGRGGSADRTRRSRRHEEASAFHVPLALARRVANWPAGTPVTLAEPFGASVLVEVVDVDGATLDVLVVRRELLTILR
jgi:hypothetical protein